MKGPNRWQCKNTLYKIYPSSYSDELINLCWYCWGGGLYPYRLILLLSLSEILTAGFRPWALVFIRTWYDLLLQKILVSRKKQSVQYSLFASTEEEFNLLFWYLQFYFHIHISLVSHFVIILFIYNGIYL